MNVICSRVKKLDAARLFDNLQAYFKFPKLVIFETSSNFRLLDVEDKSGDSFQHKDHFEVDDTIVDKIIQDRYLWLILKSGEIVVTDVISGTQIKIISDNYANYKLHQFQIINHSLILLSESGECLLAPFNAKELEEKFSAGITEITVSLERALFYRSEPRLYIPKHMINGLQVYVDQGNLIAKCPVTGVCQKFSSEIKIDHIAPWGDQAVLASKANMWLVDIKTCSIAHEFQNVGTNYYPLTAYNNKFYYLQWKKSEVQIYSAWNVSSVTEENDESYCSNRSTTNFSTEEALKTQLRALVDVALSSDSSDIDQVLPQLRVLFEKISNYALLIQNGSKLCQHNIAFKPLLHLIHKKIANEDMEMNYLFNDVMIKVDLIEYIIFKDNNSYKDVNLFQQNCKQLCITFISKSDLDLASMCWLKYSELKQNMVAEDVFEILVAIPHNIKMGALIIWLKNFAPPLLDENPYIVDLFVKWTTQRVFLLEQSSYWPKIGIKLIDEILSVLETSLKTISIRPISMDDLDVLKDHINYITELKDKYKINMLLGEISSQRPNEVALIMLRRCYTEDLEAFLQDYLPSYATRFLFELDDTLREFVENEAASCGGGIDSARLKILLVAFRSPTRKLDCLLQVLKVLDVPWDDTILDMAITAAAITFKDFTVNAADRALALEIQQELNYAKVKVVLKKYNFPLTCTNYMLVLHKLINASTVNLKDLKVITNLISAYTNYGNVLYIDRCLGDCETGEALEYFNNLNNQEKRILLKSIMIKYEQIINRNNSHNTTMERNYLDFLKGTQYLNEIEVNGVESLYHLKNTYTKNLTLNHIFNEQCCIDATATWIAGDGVTASSGRGRCVSQLTHAPRSRQSELVGVLCRTSTSNKVRKLVETLIISHRSEETNHNKSLVLHLFKDGRNSTVMIETFEVLIEIISNCAEEHIHYMLDCITILNALININIVVKNLTVAWKFHYIYLPISSTAAINDLIDYFRNKLFSNHLATWDTKVQSQSDFTLFRILGNLIGSINDDGDMVEYKDFVEIKNNTAKKLLSKVIAARELDLVLLTTLLLMRNESGEIEDKMWILDALQGQNESIPPNIMYYLSYPPIRRAFALDDILSGNPLKYSPQYILKSKFNINLGEIATEIALPDSTEETWDVKVVLFYVLRHYPNTSFKRLDEICQTLNVSINDGLSLLLISLITAWELKYKINSDDLGCQQIYVENDEKYITLKCMAIWESIDKKGFLRDILTDFWKNGEVTLHGRIVSINPYYYEIYICIYHLIYGLSAETRNKKEYVLLNFLKEYTRKSTPKQYEFELSSVNGIFPEIGHYRLPFHLFMREDMWSNLKSEITLETYERWIPMVVVLSLDADSQTARDMICSNALKQTMTTRPRKESTEKENDHWRLTTREEPLLRAAHRCVRHIANMEWAGACLFYVLQGCARGADQVAAAQLCYQFAQRWAALQPGNRAVRQMERLHSSLSTRHALHKIDWACDEFVKLATEPAQLIRALYLDANFVEKMSRHDVNRAANEIADKNGINISSIRIQILENILSKSNEDNKSNSLSGLDTKELITAKYILKATCPKMGAIYLSRIAFDDDSDFNKLKKLRALQCLMSVVDPDTALKVTYRERDTLWQSLLELLYIAKLENIDMPWLVATFVQDKSRALEQLMHSIAGNNEGLKLAANLAHRYGNVKHIKNLIPLLLRADLNEEIVPLLLNISTPPDDLIYTAWRSVILSPFQRVDYPITERQKTKCLNAVNLLPVCPVIKDEDLIEIWKNCIRCKCFGLGCLVLPYISPQMRQTLKELQKIDRRNLIASLKNLQSETYLVPGAMYVVESMASRSYR